MENKFNKRNPKFFVKKNIGKDWLMVELDGATKA